MRSVLRTAALGCVMVLLFGCGFTQRVQGQGEERPRVGFKVLWLEDQARRFANDAYTRDSRPVPALVWYPAADGLTREAPELTLGECVAHVARPADPRFSGFAAAAHDYVLGSLRTYAIEPLAGEGIDPRTLEDRLLKTPSHALLDAAPLGGSHPVVIYHPGLGGNPFENLMLCERLAARGYVVISSTFVHQEPWQDRFYCGEPATSLGDVRFLLNAAASEVPTADLGRVALMGHSYGAHVGLIAACQPNNTIDAVIVLDSTIDYASVDRIEAPFYRATSWYDVLSAVTDNASNCHAAVLNVSGTMPDGSTPDYAVVRRLVDSRLTLATVSYCIPHESFLWQSFQATSLASSLAEDTARDRDRRTYEAMTDMIIAFLNQEFMAAPKMPDRFGDDIALAKRDPIGVPTGSQALELFKRDGLDAVKDLYRALYAVSPRVRLNPNPILDDMLARQSHTEMVDFLGFLISFDTNRTTWRWQHRLGDAYRTIGDDGRARAWYGQALEHCDDFEAARRIRSQLEELSGGE